MRARMPALRTRAKSSRLSAQPHPENLSWELKSRCALTAKSSTVIPFRSIREFRSRPQKYHSRSVAEFHITYSISFHHHKHSPQLIGGASRSRQFASFKREDAQQFS